MLAQQRKAVTLYICPWNTVALVYGQTDKTGEAVFTDDLGPEDIIETVHVEKMEILEVLAVEQNLFQNIMCNMAAIFIQKINFFKEAK